MSNQVVTQSPWVFTRDALDIVSKNLPMPKDFPGWEGPHLDPKANTKQSGDQLTAAEVAGLRELVSLLPALKRLVGSSTQGREVRIEQQPNTQQTIDGGKLVDHSRGPLDFVYARGK